MQRRASHDILELSGPKYQLVLRLRTFALKKSWKKKYITFQGFHSFAVSPLLLPPPAEILHPSAEWLFCIFCGSDTRGGFLDLVIIYLTVLPLDPSDFLKRTVWIMKAYFGDKNLWSSRPFPVSPKDFTLSFLLFSIILKSYNHVLNHTLFVMLVDCSLRKLDHILDGCCPCEGSNLQSALLLWKPNIFTARVPFIHLCREKFIFAEFPFKMVDDYTSWGRRWERKVHHW